MEGEEITLYTPPEAAQLLKLSPDTLAKWRMSGQGPKYMKFGNRVRYPGEELKSYIASQLISHTGQAGGQ